MDYLWLKILGTVLFIVAMIVYVILVVRKSNRDYEYMQESNREHNEWMVQQGRMMERFDRDAEGGK